MNMLEVGDTCESNSINVLNKMSSFWGERAQVKEQEFDINLVYNPAEDDFIDELIPINNHPKFKENYEEFRTSLLACGWIAYNEKTIAIESEIITPICIDLIHGDIPGSQNEAVRWAASETLVDESYHVLMVVNAMRACKKVRDLNDLRLGSFDLVTKMNEEKANASEAWQKQIIQLVTGIVSEVFISDYLGLLSDEKNIQPINRMTTNAHRLDELAHSGIFRSFTHQIYHQLNDKQKTFFSKTLAKPIKWFASRELEIWRQILNYLDFPHSDEIINDCYTQGSSDLTRIDYSELIQLSSSVGILDSSVGRQVFIDEGIIIS